MGDQFIAIPSREKVKPLIINQHKYQYPAVSVLFVDETPIDFVDVEDRLICGFLIGGQFGLFEFYVDEDCGDDEE